MKKITLFIAALAMVFSASAQNYLDQIDVPPGHIGAIQVIMANGVAMSSVGAAGFTTNPGGWADLGPTGDFVVRAGGRTLAGDVVDVTSAYVYCVIKVRMATGQTFNPDWALAISDNPWPAANKRAWSAWIDGTDPVPAITTEWQNIVFSGYAATDWAWLSVGMESWVNGILQIEDIWFTTVKPDFDNTSSVPDYRDQVDIPVGHTGDVQVIMANGVAMSDVGVSGFTTNVGGWADLGPTGDFVVRAGGRTLGGNVIDLTAAYTYCVIKVRMVSGETFNPDWALAISDNPWPAANKRAWSAWTDGTDPVPAITTEWQNIVFSGYTAADWAWLSIGMESWVNGILQIEDIWFTTVKPVFSSSSLNLTAFNAIIAEVNGLNEADWTPESWTALQTTVTTANTMVSTASTQSEVDHAVTIIRSAIDAMIPNTNDLSSAFAEKGEPVSVEYYSVVGTKLTNTAKGLVIVKYTFADGSIRTEKLMK